MVKAIDQDLIIPTEPTRPPACSRRAGGLLPVICPPENGALCWLRFPKKPPSRGVLSCSPQNLCQLVGPGARGTLEGPFSSCSPAARRRTMSAPRLVPGAEYSINMMDSASPLTRAVLEGYLRCRYLGALRLAGEHGDSSEYFTAREERQRLVRTALTNRADHAGILVAHGMPLSRDALRRGDAPLSRCAAPWG